MAVKAVRMSLWPLFLISGAAVGYEIALTRYFAVAKWSEYGYWVISIVMVGFALSGVCVAMVRDWAVRRGAVLLAWMPVPLVLTAAAGFWATASNPFNPLQLQNAATFQSQLWNIGLYYAVLLPFFFLTGFTISLVFVLNGDRVNRVYGFDLTGAGAGAAAALCLMFVVHPFYLVPALLVPLAASALLGRPRGAVVVATLLALGASEAVLLLANPAEYNDFKAIYAPLHVPNSRQVAEIRSPRGLYALLDDFTERVDVDLSNDAGMLGVPGPTPALGLYRDGTRVAALPRASGLEASYAPGTLDALPYVLRPGARVLLAGASGGYRVAQALKLGATHIDAVEPDPVLRGAVEHGLGPSPGMAANPAVRVLGESPLAVARQGGPYDIVDISGDFLDAGEANATAYTAEALAVDLRALAPGGMLSVPVSIRELPVYAIRVLATVREALARAGVGDPGAHVVVYRSAWNLRILASMAPWSAEQLAVVKKFCDDRSFDLSYYPGIDVVAARAGIYNDLQAVNFESGEVTSGAGSDDAVADEAGAVLRGEDSESQAAFNLQPITLDRPAFYSILKLNQVPNILKRIEVLPQPEVGQLVNLAVLGQAVVLALLVLAVPLLAPRVARTAGGQRPGIVRPVLYFASLGLGFLFIEIVLIEKASLYLNDRTSAFALVLTGMLVFSGFGSLVADRVGRHGIWLVGGFIVAWCMAALFGLEPLLLSTIGLPWAARAAILLAVTAPVSVALGMPFPLGLARLGGEGRDGGAFLPWAWGLNGAFSVVATPLANLIAVQAGFDRVLIAAVMLYVLTIVSFPAVRKSLSWQASPTH
jgi:hypothetical protein